MKASSRPVKASDLGVIGEAHLLRSIGGEPSSRRYKRVEIDVDGVPYLIECAFSFRPNDGSRLMVTGLNWSASVNGNPFQSLGSYDEGLESLLTEQCADYEEPIGFILHVASPRLTFIDKGKSDVDLPAEVDNAIVAVIQQVTATWCKQRKAEKRDASAKLRRMDVMTTAAFRSRCLSLCEGAAAVFESGGHTCSLTLKVSDDGRLWAEAHQIYYAARPEILRLAQVDSVDPQTFAQTWLVNYMIEHPECANWKVAFADRGRLIEPHTGQAVGLGTRAVAAYLSAYAKPELIDGGFAGPKVSTHGPEGRYGGIWYTEKAGFDELFEEEQIAERFDLMRIVCQGMSVAAARKVVDRTCARFKVPLFILRDFDVAGFSIARTLHQSNRRYQFSTVSGEDLSMTLACGWRTSSASA